MVERASVCSDSHDSPFCNCNIEMLKIIFGTMPYVEGYKQLWDFIECFKRKEIMKF